MDAKTEQTLATLIGTLVPGGQAGALLGGLIQAVAVYRRARAAAGGADFLTDAQLAELLSQDAQALEQHATRLLQKYAPGS